MFAFALPHLIAWEQFHSLTSVLVLQICRRTVLMLYKKLLKLSHLLLRASFRRQTSYREVGGLPRSVLSFQQNFTMRLGQGLSGRFLHCQLSQLYSVCLFLGYVLSKPPCACTHCMAALCSQQVQLPALGEIHHAPIELVSLPPWSVGGVF